MPPKSIAIAPPAMFKTEAAPVYCAGAEVLLAAGPVGATEGVLVTVALPAGGETTAGLDDTAGGAPEEDLAGAGADDDLAAGVDAAGVDTAAGDEEGKTPLQAPLLQVLKAHCWLLVHCAWKFPHRGCKPELVA